MGARARNERGSILLLITLILATAGMLILSFGLERKNSLKLDKQTAQLNQEIDQLAGEISYFLSNSGACLQSFGGPFTAQAVTRDRLLRSDGTIAYSADPNTTYLQSRVQIQAFNVGGFTADPSNPLTGTAVFRVDFRVLAKKYGSTLLSRTSPVLLTLDAASNLVGCKTNIFKDEYWKTNSYGAFYTAGPVGALTAAPTSPLQLFGSDSTASTWARFGTSQEGGVDFRTQCCTVMGVGIPGGGAFAFNNFPSTPGFNPIVIQPGQQLSVNYPLGSALSYDVNLRSTDTTAWMQLRSDPSGTGPRWQFGPDPNGPTGHSVLSAQNATNPVAFIHHYTNAPAGPVDVRVGGTSARPSTNFVFYVFGPATGTGTWQIASDARLKENIVPLENSLEQVCRLKGYTFSWKDPSRGDGREMGLVAQELLENHVAEDLVDCSGAFCTLQYSPLTALLTQAAQELDRKQTAWEKKLKKIRTALAISPKLGGQR